MNRNTMDMLRMMRDRRARRDGGYGRYAGSLDYEGDYADHRHDYEDGRRGDRRDGRHDYADHRDYVDNRDRRDYDDRHDYRDYGESAKLTKREMEDWKHRLINADGSKGEHFDMRRVISAADKVNAKYRRYDEKDFCMTMNMLWSDYGEALNGHFPQSDEDIIFAKMAKAFLEDPDSPKGSEKLSLYYNCVVMAEDD